MTADEVSAEHANMFEPSELKIFRRRLTRWYRIHRRSLPWRTTRDPYRIWISEIMLQQTTVQAVIPYFERFLERFPTVTALAAASEDEVLQYWEGLGYYSRGRNLLKAARLVCEQHGGQFPRTVEELQKLPGIGKYTAGAIRSFAFDLPAAIVEANTLRLYTRLLNFTDDPRSPSGQAELWTFAETLQPARRAGQLNQALMEVGSLICRPRDPACDACPIQVHCRAFAAGTQQDVPLRQQRPQITKTVEATVAIECDGRFLVQQRQGKARWAGMWDFPRQPVASVSFEQRATSAVKSTIIRELTANLPEGIALTSRATSFIDEIVHSVTRYRIRLLCLKSRLSDASYSGQLAETFRWLSLAELDELPMPKTGRQFANRLRELPS